jgi:uroporphyrinogen-III synthase
MRFLLTRAQEDATRTGAKLEALGHQVLESPVITFVATGQPWPGRPPHGLIATSARAFVGMETEELDIAAWRMVPLYLTGGQTEAAAREHGFAGPARTAPDSARLIEILTALPDARLLYLAGTDRKPAIEDALGKTGHRLSVLETYCAVAATVLTPEAVAALRDGRIDAVLHYSRRSAAIFTSLAAAAGVDVTRCTHFCLSRDVAAPLLTAGCADVRIAAQPDEETLMGLMTIFTSPAGP